MSRKAVLCITLFVLMALNHNYAEAKPKVLIYPIEVSGKILDKDGNIFTGQTEVKLDVSTDTIDMAARPGSGLEESSETKVYTIPTQAGTFSWTGEGSDLSIEAVKEGYHSTMVTIYDDGKTVKSSDILIYLIPKGTPSKLEYTENADIPDKTDPKSGGKDCGWSFTKRWYFPVAEEETAWMTLSFNEKGDAVYTMKEPGGFIWYPGYPQFESKPNELSASFEWMTEAPETGYVQTFTPIDHYYRPNVGQEIYCYFRTPDGKYGKICFSGRFDYYLQPDGTRNLEAGEIVKKYPINPIEANRHKGY